MEFVLRIGVITGLGAVGGQGVEAAFDRRYHAASIGGEFSPTGLDHPGIAHAVGHALGSAGCGQPDLPLDLPAGQQPSQAGDLLDRQVRAAQADEIDRLTIGVTQSAQRLSQLAVGALARGGWRPDLGRLGGAPFHVE